MKKILAVVISIALLSGCGPKELSPEQNAQIEELKSELARTEDEIAAANEMDSKYSGGLIKSLILTRVEVLGTNKALLQQRINAIESGAKIEIVVSGQQENLEKAKEIEGEISSLRAEIGDLQKDADRYSGGLIRDLKLSAIATQEQTIAFLQQKYLMAKYGISISGNEKIVDGKGKNSSQIGDEEKQKSKPLIPPADGPFGFKMGMTMDDIVGMTGRDPELISEQENLYLLAKAPKDNSDFASYGVMVSPTYGLCEIRAIGNDIVTNGFGGQVMGRFDDMKSSLESIYGKPKVIDKLLSGSIWREPADWMVGLTKKERFLNAEWTVANENMDKNNLSSIGLEARGQNMDSGFIFLQYTFKNKNECLNEIKEAKKSSL